MKNFRFALALLVCAPAVAIAEDAPESISVFERVFGIERMLPEDKIEAVKALPPGERLELDTNGDGRINEMWYLDTAKRHTVSPLLVRVVDEDGDMHEMGRGDRNSDLYFFDYEADGYINAVIDYQDTTGDGNLDAMGIFFDKNWRDDKDDLTVWWSEDIGNDNLLWFDVNGNYYQPLCQWRTHFAGDEVFYQFRLTEDDDKWVNVWEDPFAFYDIDGDGNSEEVVRISAVGHDVQNLRYSIDANNGAQGRMTRNFDFSITALPPEEGISTEGWAETTYEIRGIETHPVLDWDNTREFSKQAPWGHAMLSWNEINSNTHNDPSQEPEERWEGVLNHASKFGDFPQVGGPPCSVFNNRVEVAKPPASPLRLYYDPYDHRLHLPGAQYGYLDVDYNLDGEADAAYAYEDTTGDGMLDMRRADLNNNGEWDFEWPLAGPEREFDITFEEIMPFYTALLRGVLESSQRFMDVGAMAFDELPSPVASVIDYFTGPLLDYHPERQIGERIRSTDSGARFYMDLARDRLFAALRAELGDESGWDTVETHYAQGEFSAAADALADVLGVSPPNGGEFHAMTVDGHEYTRRAPVHIDNTGGPYREQWPVRLDVDALREAAPDFNPNHCAVAMGDRWLDWFELPHQVDDWDFDGVERLTFLSDIPADAQATFYVYYEPEGERAADFPLLTNAVLDNPGHVAWESEYAGYRFYTGQFDIFGKHVWRRLPKPDRLIYPLIDVNYHEEQEWGIDTLHVGTTSGLGGVTLYEEDAEHLAQSPAGEGDVAFEHRVIGVGPLRSAVEIEMTNVVPGQPDAVVLMRCYADADQQHSEIQVQLPPELAEMDIAPAMMKLEEEDYFIDETLGVIGLWGRQGDDIGEIGMGLIAPPDQIVDVVDAGHERRFRCQTEDQVLRYWIIGEWRRGMQYPVAPSLANWRRTLSELAPLLNEPPRIALGAGESAD